MLTPGEDGFDGEFGQRLHPCEDGQRKALGDKELGGFGTPGDEHGGDDDAGCGPEDGPW